MAPLSYVLPLRWSDDAGLDELTGYLRSLADAVDELIVVDGSPDPLFSRHAEAWSGVALHLRPDPDIVAPMGKVAGVVTGLRWASHERVVIADDDVRYGSDNLRRTADLLAGADLVRPQNYFQPASGQSLPWHARWDMARTLLNRCFGRDFPGTLAVRRSSFMRTGGYAGDVIFENLELIRTIEAAGGTVVSPLDLYVARRPPTTAQFLSQRVRQAYDDFAIPARMTAFLALGPVTLAAVALGHPWFPAALAGLGTAAAEIGRRRAGGAAVFPASSSALAPAWLAERAVCSWLAVVQRLRRGGIPYGGGVVPRAASSKRRLRAALQRGPSSASRPDPSARKPVSL